MRSGCLTRAPPAWGHGKRRTAERTRGPRSTGSLRRNAGSDTDARSALSATRASWRSLDLSVGAVFGGTIARKTCHKILKKLIPRPRSGWTREFGRRLSRATSGPAPSPNALRARGSDQGPSALPGRDDRPENLSQHIEKINSAPGFGGRRRLRCHCAACTIGKQISIKVP